MQIQFLKKLTDYKYLIMFDLASKVTGVCCWDIEQQKPIKWQVLRAVNKTDSKAKDFYDLLDDFFHSSFFSGIDKKDILVYKEAMPQQMHNSASTVQTFLALARTHAIFELYLEQNGIDTYDHIGVYPITTHSYLKRIQEWDSTHSVVKNDIIQYVKKKYDIREISPDEADAIFLAETFVFVKWDRDIENEIKTIKNHIKTLKAPLSIAACKTNIVELQNKFFAKGGP